MNKCSNPECGWEGDVPLLGELTPSGFLPSICPVCGESAPFQSHVKHRGQLPEPITYTPKWELTDIVCPICGDMAVERYGTDNLMILMERGEVILVVPLRRCTSCKMLLHMYEEVGGGPRG